MQFGPYIIQRELARGGQGAVYLAHHQTLRVPVAIKVVLEPDPQTNKRFKQEARILANLKHPNLLSVVDLGQVGHRPYLAMEYIEGSDLKRLVSQQGIPSFDWLVDTFSTLAEVLDYIHDRGLIHRDIKPANIFLEDGSNRILLVDFGLVKRDPNKMSMGSLDRSRLSMTGDVAGTPAFMAPEQADPSYGDVGPWTDFYALGATLYYMLTGQAPFKGTTAYNILVKLFQDMPVDPREYDPDIPDYLAELTLQCMSKDPAERPQDGSEFKSLLLPRPKPRNSGRRLYKIGAAVLAMAGFGGLVHYLITREGFTPQEAEITAEDIAETTTTSSPAPIATPVPRVRTLEELVADADRSQREDPERTFLIAEELIALYPRFYRGYVYRAAANYGRWNATQSRDARLGYREAILADYERAIELCDSPAHKARLQHTYEQIKKDLW